MTARQRLSPGAVGYALLLLISLLALGWVCLRTTLVEIMPPGDRTVAAIAGRSPDVVFDRAMVEFLEKRGMLAAPALAQVRDAAEHAPLDSRPFLFLGAEDLLQNQPARALKVFEAGQRLDPRDRWIRILLLDRYLRAHRYREAAVEMAVLNRLAAEAQAPIIAEMARMARDPATRDAVRQTLAEDPAMEESLLTTLAQNSTDPQLLLQLASPRARAIAARPNGWGQALVTSMVARGRFQAARAVWARLFHVPTAAAQQPLYNSDFQTASGQPPFAWDFSGGAAGAATPQAGQLTVDYYGRDNATLASQLLVLPAGRYKLNYTLVGSAGTGLAWTLTCADGGTAAIGSFPVPGASGTAKHYLASFSVPASGCGAQWLRLVGIAAEFPSPVNVTLSGLSLQRVATGS